MKATVQPRSRISGLRQRAVSAVLTLAVIVLPAIVATQPAQAQTFTTLAHIGATHFKAGVVLDAAGNLYGTDPEGGIRGGVCGSYGCGYLFKVDPTGSVTVLYEFTGGPTDIFQKRA
jgi:uncharacterized repeat protein (TIGR03803 family)